jgi:HEAT repeat protein
MSRMKMMKHTAMALVLMAMGWGTAEAQQANARAGRLQAEATVLVGEVDSTVQAPAPWIQEDPGSQAYTSAREALNARRYQEAAEAFARLRQDYPRSAYAADSYYYQAFSLSRVGGRSEYREARELLTTQMDEYPESSTYSDARDLYSRVESQLARGGDARAAANITQQAQDPCGPDQEIRSSALQALLTMNSERALPILREVLQERDACSAELREQAVFLIAQHMDDEAVDILLDLAHRNPDPDPGVREQAVFWLSQVDTEEALVALEAILRESDDPEIQENAIFAISQHDSERSGQILREYAERSDVPADLKEDVLFWIGQSPGGTEYLKSLWNTLEDPELKENVLFGVAQEESEENKEWLVARAMDTNEDPEVRENALFWAGQMGAFTIPELRELFNGFSDPDMKEQVVFVASQRSEPEAVDFLMEVAEDPENGEIRENAIFWLGQSDDPRVPEFLLRIIGR